ncbi:MAG TPA: DUF6624 domain-containing protein [Chloroflexia bacterium]|jgi:hypothetical protein
MNEPLRAELLEMERADRAKRAELVARGELHKPGYHPEMEEVHRRHNARMREIIESHGWPGRSLVGDDGCRAAGFVVQHAILDPELQRRCVGLLTDAVEHGEADGFMLALLTDRVLVQEGKLQIYGTQYTGAPGGGVEPLPVAEPDKVDERRRAVGLPPLAENTARLNSQHAQELARMSQDSKKE